MTTTLPATQGIQRKVIHATADVTLERNDSGSLLTNLGASGAVVYTLPQDAESGETFYGIVMAAQAMRFDPGAAGAIYINGAKQTDDKYITSSVIGARIKLVADGNGDWVASDYWEQEVSSEYVAASVDKRFYNANRGGSVVAARLTPNVAGTDGSAVTAMLEKVPSGTAIGSGVDLLSASLDLKGTVNTVQAGSLTATVADRDFVAGDSLAIDFTGTLTAATGVVSVKLSEWRVEA